MSVYDGSCTAASCAERADAKRTLQSRSRGCGRKRSCGRSPARGSPGDEALDEAAFVRRVRRRVPGDEHDGARRSRARALPTIASYASRERRRWNTSLCGHPVTTTRSRLDPVVPDEIVAHDLVLDDVAARREATRCPCRPCGPSSRRSRRPGGRASALRSGTARPEGSGRWRRQAPSTLSRMRANERLRDVPAGEKSHARPEPVEPLRVREPPRERRVQEEVRVARPHPLTVEAVAEAVANRQRVVAGAPVEREVDAPSGSARRGRRCSGKRSAPSVHGTPPRRAPTRQPRRRGARGRPPPAPAAAAASFSTIPQSTKTRVGKGSGRTSQTLRWLSEGGMSPIVREPGPGASTRSACLRAPRKPRPGSR